MSAMSDLIEDWIQIRSTLQRQLKTLDPNEGQGPVDIPDEMREMTVNHKAVGRRHILSAQGVHRSPIIDGPSQLQQANAAVGT